MEKIARAVRKLGLRSRPRRIQSLPYELWLSVFEQDPLSHDDGFHIRLTCKSFATLARALVFRRFNFRPSGTVSDESVNHDAARLTFWSSDAIAPFVRECAIFSKINHETQLHIMFFHVLPVFVNVSFFQCQGIRFDDFALNRTAQLKELKTIVLDDCIVVVKDRPAILEIPNVHFGSDAVPSDGEVHRGAYGWMDILCPTSTRRLTLKFAEPHPWCLRGIMTARSPSHINNRDCFAQHFARIIKHPTALEALVVQPFRKCANKHLPLIPGTRVPTLREYRGPPELLDCFAPGEGLRSLGIYCRIKERAMGAGHVFGIHPHPHRLLQLELEIRSLPAGFLEQLSKEYPNVKILDIVTNEIELQVCRQYCVHSLY